MTGRDDKLPSVLVLAQDGRTAPLRTLMGSADLDQKNIPGLRALLSSCLGLVTVEASSSTVRLVHFTLQEHLLSSLTLFHSPHSTIAEVCLTYLNFECIRDISPTLYRFPPKFPFLEYAILFWGKHARMGMTENVKILALKLLDRFDQHISAQTLVYRYLCKARIVREDFIRAEGLPGFTGLHGVAFIGIVEIVAAVLGMKEWDVNATDFMGSTALAWAARKGNEEVVKMLLEREDVNASQAETKFVHNTPLLLAAEEGHGGLVKMILEREGVNPNQGDINHKTPLSLAATRGHEGIVQILLECEEVNPDQADTKYGRTPFSWAAGRGNEGVVKMLLERKEVNPDQADTKYG